MELNLTPLFWPTNSTIVRSFKFRLGLAGQRAWYRLLWRLAPGKAIESGVRQLLTPPRHRFPDVELRLMEDASLLPVPMITGRLIGWRWGGHATRWWCWCTGGAGAAPNSGLYRTPAGTRSLGRGL